MMPRVPPITGKADVAPEYHYVVDEVVKVFGNVRGPFSMLLHSPKLAGRLLRLVTFYREDSMVEGRLRSLAVLAAVREREAAYVGAAQVGAARRAGVREEAIDLIRAKGAPAALRRAVAARTPGGRACLRVHVRYRQRVRGAGAGGWRPVHRVARDTGRCWHRDKTASCCHGVARRVRMTRWIENAQGSFR